MVTKLPWQPQCYVNNFAILRVCGSGSLIAGCGHNMQAAGWKLWVRVAICRFPVITCRPQLEIAGKSPVDLLASLSSIRRQVKFSKGG